MIMPERTRLTFVVEQVPMFTLLLTEFSRATASEGSPAQSRLFKVLKAVKGLSNAWATSGFTLTKINTQ